MSGHARSASANFAVEIHFDSDDERTLLHDTEQRRDPHSESGDRRMSQQRQLLQLPKGREPQRWINETEWITYIKEDPRVRLRPSSVVSIFRVPKLLKDTKREAYVPQRVSLGPHHHGSAELPPMGHHKGRALRRMMKSSNNMDFAERAREEILKLENEIRDSYEENIDCNGKTLAWMLSLDGCFILEALRSLGGEYKVNNCYDPIFDEYKIDFAAREIGYDIFMLENQVPLIVLQKLLELELNSTVDVKEISNMVLKATVNMFNPFGNENINIKQWSWPKSVEQQPHHLLGLLHTVIVSPLGVRVDEGECVDQRDCIECCSRHCIVMLQDKDNASDDISIPRAVELRNAGIKFKRSDGGIKEIQFDPNSGTIFHPPIFIRDGTEVLFRNLLAFEMCKPSETNYVACYVSLMDELIDSEEDVALLRRMGILTNWLGSDKEVADFFNSLCKEVTMTMEDAFYELRKEVNAHYKNKMKVQFAELVRDHFSSPWKVLALVAATVILMLTTVQTIFSIIK